MVAIYPIFVEKIIELKRYSLKILSMLNHSEPDEVFQVRANNTIVCTTYRLAYCGTNDYYYCLIGSQNSK